MIAKKWRRAKRCSISDLKRYNFIADCVHMYLLYQFHGPTAFILTSLQKSCKHNVCLFSVSVVVFLCHVL